jgi:hypothetical protein
MVIQEFASSRRWLRAIMVGLALAAGRLTYEVSTYGASLRQWRLVILTAFGAWEKSWRSCLDFLQAEFNIEFVMGPF